MTDLSLLSRRLDGIEARLDGLERGMAELITVLTRVVDVNPDGETLRRPEATAAQRRAMQLEKAARMREAKAAKRLGMRVVNSDESPTRGTGAGSEMGHGPRAKERT